MGDFIMYKTFIRFMAMLQLLLIMRDERNGNPRKKKVSRANKNSALQKLLIFN